MGKSPKKCRMTKAVRALRFVSRPLLVTAQTGLAEQPSVLSSLGHAVVPRRMVDTTPGPVAFIDMDLCLSRVAVISGGRVYVSRPGGTLRLQLYRPLPSSGPGARRTTQGLAGTGAGDEKQETSFFHLVAEGPVLEADAPGMVSSSPLRELGPSGHRGDPDQVQDDGSVIGNAGDCVGWAYDAPSGGILAWDDATGNGLDTSSTSNIFYVQRGLGGLISGASPDGTGSKLPSANTLGFPARNRFARTYSVAVDVEYLSSESQDGSLQIPGSSASLLVRQSGQQKPLHGNVKQQGSTLHLIPHRTTASSTSSQGVNTELPLSGRQQLGAIVERRQSVATFGDDVQALRPTPSVLPNSVQADHSACSEAANGNGVQAQCSTLAAVPHDAKLRHLTFEMASTSSLQRFASHSVAAPHQRRQGDPSELLASDETDLGEGEPWKAPEKLGSRCPCDNGSLWCNQEVQRCYAVCPWPHTRPNEMDCKRRYSGEGEGCALLPKERSQMQTNWRCGTGLRCRPSAGFYDPDGGEILSGVCQEAETTVASKASVEDLATTRDKDVWVAWADWGTEHRAPPSVGSGGQRELNTASTSKAAELRVNAHRRHAKGSVARPRIHPEDADTSPSPHSKPSRSADGLQMLEGGVEAADEDQGWTAPKDLGSPCPCNNDGLWCHQDVQRCYALCPWPHTRPNGMDCKRRYSGEGEGCAFSPHERRQMYANWRCGSGLRCTTAPRLGALAPDGIERLSGICQAVPLEK